MSSTHDFLGAGFRVVGAEAIGESRVRISFSTDPRQSNPANADDGLNPNNYVLTGPGSLTVASVAVVGGDPESLDLETGANLSTGHWTVTASNILTPSGTALGYPTFGSFDVSTGVDLSTLTAGSEVDSAVRIIRKHLSPALRGPNWDAVIEGLSQGDDINWEIARSAFDQLFVSSAGGKYLDRLAASRGLARPTDTGIDDSRYRQLVTRLTNSKVTLEALREILETFYGTDALRAWADTGLEAPFHLGDGDVLRVLIDETQEIEIDFSSQDFTAIGNASAQELAAALTSALRARGSKAWANHYRNPDTGLEKVRLYSPSLGLKSFVRILGGSAQPALQFPRYRSTYSGSTAGLGLAWTYSHPVPGTTRLLMTTVGIPVVDISSVEPGDYVVVGNGVIDGDYVVSNVYYSWDVPHTNYTQVLELAADVNHTGALTQQANSDYSFFASERQSILNGDRTVVVAQSQRGEVDVQVPATTAAVNRGPTTGSYGRDSEVLGVRRLVRDRAGVVTLDFETAPLPALATGDQVVISGLRAPRGLPYVTSGFQGTYPAVATSSGSHRSCLSDTQLPPSSTEEMSQGLLLSTGDVLLTGGYQFSTSLEEKACNRFRLVGPSSVADGSEAEGATAFQYQWIATADLNTEREEHQVSNLGNGQALLSGGFNNTAGFAVLDSTEVYDPGADTWTPGPVMVGARFGHRQVELESGSVLVCGGCDGGFTVQPTVEVYDVGTSLFTASAPMDTARYYHQAARLPDGRVIVTGGSSSYGALNTEVTLNSTEFWDPNTGIWSPGPPMSHTRSRHQMKVLADGRVWVGGGVGKDPTASGDNDVLKSAEIYDPATGRWHPLPALLYPVFGFGVQSLSDGGFLAAGGWVTLGLATNAGIQNMSPDFRWKLSPLQNDYNRYPFASPGSDVVVFSGGNDGANTMTQAMLWVPAADTSTAAGLNAQLKVASVVSPTRVTLQAQALGYCSNWGPDSGVVSTSAQRTSNVTAVTVGAAATTFRVGDVIYFNSNSTDFSSGFKTLTAVGTTTLSFVDFGADTGVVTLNTPVGTAMSPEPVVKRGRAISQSLSDPGPYVFDPDAGLPVTGVATTLVDAISQGLQTDRLHVASDTGFPDGNGWLVLGFGTSNQSEPIRYLETIGSDILLLDFKWRPGSSYPVGTSVVLLRDRLPFQPSASVLTGNLYATGSNAGLLAAETTTQAAAAAGIRLNFEIVYPGGRGLGAESWPTSGVGKLSDIMKVFGP